MPDVQGWFQELALAEAWGCYYTAVRRLRSSFRSRLLQSPSFQERAKVWVYCLPCLISDGSGYNEPKRHIRNSPRVHTIAQRAWLRGFNGLWVWNCRGDLGALPFSSLRSSRKLLLLWNSIQTTLCLLYLDNPFIHGHRTLKAPHPVWSAQLTRVPPS